MNDVLVSFDELVSTLKQILLKFGFEESRAIRCATLFAKADLDGVRSRGQPISAFPGIYRKGLCQTIPFTNNTE